MSYNASEKTSVDKKKTEVGRQRKNDEDVVQQLLSTSNGRSWMWRLLERCHIFDICADMDNPNSTYFQLGERNIGNILLSNVMRAAPDLYMIMAKEAKENEDV